MSTEASLLRSSETERSREKNCKNLSWKKTMRPCPGLWLSMLLYTLAFWFFSSTISSQRAFYHFCKNQENKKRKSFSLHIMYENYMLLSNRYTFLKVILAIKWCNQKSTSSRIFWERVKSIFNDLFFLSAGACINMTECDVK